MVRRDALRAVQGLSLGCLALLAVGLFSPAMTMYPKMDMNDGFWFRLLHDLFVAGKLHGRIPEKWSCCQPSNLIGNRTL